MEFDTVENAYIAWKTLDYEQRKLIQSISAYKAKVLSTKKQINLRDDYCDDGRLAIMYDLLLQKFSDRNPELKQKLIDTGTATIIEGNFHNDMFFGFFLKTGCGNNNLGKMHMKIRALLLNI